MKRYAAVMACLLAAGCGGQTEPAGSPAPEPGMSRGEGPGMGMGGMGMGGGMGAPPVYALIGARERLSLTSAQVTALDSLGERLERQNRELRRQLEDRGFRPGSRPTQAQMEAARPVFEQIRQNNTRTMEAVGALLNEEQRQGACTLQREGREEGRGGRRGGGVREGGGRGGRQGGRMGGGMEGRRPGGMAADSMMMGRSRGWPWCPAPGRGTPPAR